MSNYANKGIHVATDNEDEDYPPEFTTLASEIDKCKQKISYFLVNLSFISIKSFGFCSQMEPYRRLGRVFHSRVSLPSESRHALAHLHGVSQPISDSLLGLF
jgi:hypothetical protein